MVQRGRWLGGSKGGATSPLVNMRLCFNAVKTTSLRSQRSVAPTRQKRKETTYG